MVKNKLLINIISAALLLALPAAARTYLGNYSRYQVDNNIVRIFADTSSLRISFYTEDIVRVDFIPTPTTFIDSSFVVIQRPRADVTFITMETDSTLTFKTGRMQICLHKFPLRISFADTTGSILLSEPLTGGISTTGEMPSLRFIMAADNHFYGTGERGIALDKRGLKFESYNTQVGGYSTPLATMNINIPLVTTTNGYALYIDNTWKGKFDFGASDPTFFTYTAAGGSLTYYFIAGSTIPEQLKGYTWLTGRQPLPPRWAFGFIQSKNRYDNEADARSVVDTMRMKHIPCDGLVLDLKWFRSMGDIAWDDSLWPHHRRMVADFLDRGIKTILITEPYIIELSKNFAEAEADGYFAKDSAGRPYLLPNWWSCGSSCSAALLDITNPAARQWWWSRHPDAFGPDVAGIWTDLGEPERHPDGMQHYLGSAEKIHNIYNLLWAKTIFDGFHRIRPGSRVFNVTRSGFAGMQRYGVLPWSGDVARSFGGLQVQLPILLGMGMSGVAYQNSDIGGYARVPTTPELYIRWMEFGTFCPIARAHGAGETVGGYPTEPWRFGDTAETICRKFIQLRYRLIPYIYSLAWQNYTSGMPLARPLFWLDNNDTALTNESSSYMWGDAFLVSPVVTAGERTKKLYLPKGTWYDYWTDEVVDGGKTVTVAAPLNELPMFVKGGSIIPMEPVMENSDQRPLDTLTLQIYPDPGTTMVSSFSLYEDDGTTERYKTNNEFRTTTITFNNFTLNLNIGASVGSYRGAPGQRALEILFHGVRKKMCAVVNGKKTQEGVVWSETSKTLSVFVKKTSVIDPVLIALVPNCP